MTACARWLWLSLALASCAGDDSVNGLSDASLDAPSDGGPSAVVCRMELNGVPRVLQASGLLTWDGYGVRINCSAGVEANLSILVTVGEMAVGAYVCGPPDDGRMHYYAEVSTWEAPGPGATCAITIDAVGGGRARGTLAGTLARVKGMASTDAYVVTNGVFDLPLRMY